MCRRIAGADAASSTPRTRAQSCTSRSSTSPCPRCVVCCPSGRLADAWTQGDFLKQGGTLGSGVQHHEAGVLTEGGCDRQVDGVGERMARDLGAFRARS